MNPYYKMHEAHCAPTSPSFLPGDQQCFAVNVPPAKKSECKKVKELLQHSHSRG